MSAKPRSGDTRFRAAASRLDEDFVVVFLGLTPQANLFRRFAAKST
jgi:hypothetical protein